MWRCHRSVMSSHIRLRTGLSLGDAERKQEAGVGPSWFITLPRFRIRDKTRLCSARLRLKRLFLDSFPRKVGVKEARKRLSAALLPTSGGGFVRFTASHSLAIGPPSSDQCPPLTLRLRTPSCLDFLLRLQLHVANIHLRCVCVCYDMISDPIFMNLHCFCVFLRHVFHFIFYHIEL